MGKSAVVKLFLQTDFLNLNYFDTKFRNLTIFCGTSLTKRYDLNNILNLLNLSCINVFSFKYKSKDN